MRRSWRREPPHVPAMFPDGVGGRTGQRGVASAARPLDLVDGDVHHQLVGGEHEQHTELDGVRDLHPVERARRAAPAGPPPGRSRRSGRSRCSSFLCSVGVTSVAPCTVRACRAARIARNGGIPCPRDAIPCSARRPGSRRRRGTPAGRARWRCGRRCRRPSRRPGRRSTASQWRSSRSAVGYSTAAGESRRRPTSSRRRAARAARPTRRSSAGGPSGRSATLPSPARRGCGRAQQARRSCPSGTGPAIRISMVSVHDRRDTCMFVQCHVDSCTC